MFCMRAIGGPYRRLRVYYLAPVESGAFVHLEAMKNNRDGQSNSWLEYCMLCISRIGKQFDIISAY